MPSVRDLMAMGRRASPQFTSLNGAGGRDWSQGFRDAAGTVTESDLRELGLPLGPMRLSSDMRGAVDPSALAFEALKKAALAKAQGNGAGLAQAQKLQEQADMAKVGREEVLRRRQQDFNAAGAAAPQGSFSPLTGSAPDPRITAATGAAVASSALAGRPYELPEADRQVSLFQREVAFDRAGDAAERAQADAQGDLDFRQAMTRRTQQPAMAGLQRAQKRGTGGRMQMLGGLIRGF